MLISYNWIKELTNVKEPAKNLADKLTMAGIEVSSIKKEKNDYIYDAEITPNRPDLLSIVGIAREAAALTNNKLTLPQIEPIDKKTGKDIDIQIKVPSSCLRYNATLIKNTKIKISNQKITRRLNNLDIKPINNIVDITNYCLLETGQPLHAFDYDKIKGGRVIVRWAKNNESIRAIDGNKYKLDNTILVIADSQKPIAIAGIMGGIETEIGLDTKNVLLECAHFDPLVIRRASRKLGLSSNSSYRFERGICIQNIPQVAQRASSLIVQFSNSTITDTVDIFRKKAKKKLLDLRETELSRILGFNIPVKEVRRILTRLGFKVISSTKGKIKVKIPVFRQDISREVDLIEEVARIYGYHNITNTLAKISAKLIQQYKSSPQIRENFKYKAKQALKNFLISEGLNEIISYSLINGKEIKFLGFETDKLVSIINPLSSEQAILRPTLVLGLLNTVKWNINRQINDIAIFELGKVFYKRNKKIQEEERLAICLCGNKFLGDWQIKPKAVNFFDLKGIIEDLLASFNLSNYKFNYVDHGLFVKGQSAEILRGATDIGFIGKVKKNILEHLDLETDVYMAEIDFDKILPQIKMERKLAAIPKFPYIIRDLAVIVKEDVAAKSVTDQILTVGKSLIKEVTLFDVYRGKQIPSGYKSLAYSIKYQSQERTLRDEEVDKIQGEIKQRLVENLKAQIR